ncbi:MAG: hypothetical protein ACOYUZ_01015 [Patescibacteria group bacterium]
MRNQEQALRQIKTPEQGPPMQEAAVEVQGASVEDVNKAFADMSGGYENLVQTPVEGMEPDVVAKVKSIDEKADAKLMEVKVQAEDQINKVSGEPQLPLEDNSNLKQLFAQEPTLKEYRPPSGDYRGAPPDIEVATAEVTPSVREAVQAEGTDIEVGETETTPSVREAVRTEAIEKQEAELANLEKGWQQAADVVEQEQELQALEKGWEQAGRATEQERDLRALEQGWDEIAEKIQPASEVKTLAGIQPAEAVPETVTEAPPTFVEAAPPSAEFTLVGMPQEVPTLKDLVSDEAVAETLRARRGMELTLAGTPHEVPTAKAGPPSEVQTMMGMPKEIPTVTSAEAPPTLKSPREDAEPATIREGAAARVALESEAPTLDMSPTAVESEPLTAAEAPPTFVEAAPPTIAEAPPTFREEAPPTLETVAPTVREADVRTLDMPAEKAPTISAAPSPEALAGAAAGAVAMEAMIKGETLRMSDMEEVEIAVNKRDEIRSLMGDEWTDLYSAPDFGKDEWEFLDEDEKKRMQELNIEGLDLDIELAGLTQEIRALDREMRDKYGEQADVSLRAKREREMRMKEIANEAKLREITKVEALLKRNKQELKSLQEIARQRKAESEKYAGMTEEQVEAAVKDKTQEEIAKKPGLVKRMGKWGGKKTWAIVGGGLVTGAFLIGRLINNVPWMMKKLEGALTFLDRVVKGDGWNALKEAAKMAEKKVDEKIEGKKSKETDSEFRL